MVSNLSEARSGNRWQVGETVRVGFMRLRVTERIPTPGDGFPDEYRLVDDRSGRTYSFVPHNGLVRL